MQAQTKRVQPIATASPSPPVDGSWRRTSFRFRLQLGEWTFAAYHAPTVVRGDHFLELGPLDELKLPRDQFADCACFVVLSQPVERRLPLLSRHQGLWRYAPHQYEHAIVRLQGSFESYLQAQFPGERKKKLQYQVRRLCQKVGNDQPVREYRGEAEFRRFYRLATALSERTYQMRLLGRGLADESVDEWAALAARDQARGWILFHDARPIAFIAGRTRGDVFEDEYIGYDPEYAKLGPGTVLHYLVLQRLFAEGRFSAWDFGEGEALHKERFANLLVPCADLYFFPPRAESLALLTSQASLHLASRGAVTLLDRLHLKGRIKSLLRRRSAG